MQYAGMEDGLELSEHKGYNRDFLIAKFEESRRGFMKKLGAALLGSGYSDAVPESGSENERLKLAGDQKVTAVKTGNGSYGFFINSDHELRSENSCEILTGIEKLLDQHPESEKIYNLFDTNTGREVKQVEVNVEELNRILESAEKKSQGFEDEKKEVSEQKYSQSIEEWMQTGW